MSSRRSRNGALIHALIDTSSMTGASFAGLDMVSGGDSPCMCQAEAAPESLVSVHACGGIFGPIRSVGLRCG